MLLKQLFYRSTFFLFFIITGFLFQCRISQNSTLLIGEVQYPKDNPISIDKIILGKKLFFDKRLSSDESISCSTCHLPEFAFTDRKTVSEGVKGRRTLRNSPSLLNSGFLQTVMFDAHLTSLEMQVIVPIQEHDEMDIKMLDLLKKLKNVPEYQEAAKKIFNRDFDAFVLTRSISAFERSLISKNSRFDIYYSGKNKKALSKDEIAGWKLFSEKLYCTKCHPAPYFTNFKAENNGLYSDYKNDQGRFRILNDSLEIGKFKVPSLRNIELTYPYMHDGSKKSIDEIISHYQTGGKKHHLQNSIIQEFNLSTKERKQLIVFFKSLTDTSYMTEFR